jgi:hypothetical protein
MTTTIRTTTLHDRARPEQPYVTLQLKQQPYVTKATTKRCLKQPYATNMMQGNK